VRNRCLNRKPDPVVLLSPARNTRAGHHLPLTPATQTRWVRFGGTALTHLHQSQVGADRGAAFIQLHQDQVGAVRGDRTHPSPSDSGGCRPGGCSYHAHACLDSVERAESRTTVTTWGDNNPALDAWLLEVTSKTVPVYAVAIPTAGLPLPILAEAASQLLLAAGLGIITILLLLPGGPRPARAVFAEAQ